MQPGKEKVRRVTVVKPVVGKQNGVKMRIGRAFEREDGTLDIFLDVPMLGHERIFVEKADVE